MKIPKGIFFFLFRCFVFLLGQYLKTINNLSFIFQDSIEAIIPDAKYAFFFMLCF